MLGGLEGQFAGFPVIRAGGASPADAMAADNVVDFGSFFFKIAQPKDNWFLAVTNVIGQQLVHGETPPHERNR